jgi:hypothetical protein
MGSPRGKASSCPRQLAAIICSVTGSCLRRLTCHFCSLGHIGNFSRLGRRLFAAAKLELKEAGYDRLLVWALKDNEHACAFYDALGGVELTTVAERFGGVSLPRVAFAWGVNVKSSNT